MKKGGLTVTKKNLVPLTSLINARKEMNLTQEELATLAGISRALISNIERGEYNPSLHVAYRISRTLKKPIEQIFFKQNARKTNISA